MAAEAELEEGVFMVSKLKDFRINAYQVCCAGLHASIDYDDVHTFMYGSFSKVWYLNAMVQELEYLISWEGYTSNDDTWEPGIHTSAKLMIAH